MTNELSKGQGSWPTAMQIDVVKLPIDNFKMCHKYIFLKCNSYYNEINQI